MRAVFAKKDSRLFGRESFFARAVGRYFPYEANMTNGHWRRLLPGGCAPAFARALGTVGLEHHVHGAQGSAA